MSTTGSTKDRTEIDPDTNLPTDTVDDAEPDPATEFLAWLESGREANKMSWAEVSRRSGISENGLRRIRQGEVTPRPATVHALAKALGNRADDVYLSAAHEDTGAPTPWLAMQLKDYGAPIPARRSAGEAVIYLTVGVASPRAQGLDRETAGRLILFLEASARAWLATSDCTESD